MTQVDNFAVVTPLISLCLPTVHAPPSPHHIIRSLALVFAHAYKVILYSIMPQMIIIICPSCSAPYALPPGAIGPEGQFVRCSSCGHEWQQEQPTSTADLAPPEAGLFSSGAQPPAPAPALPPQPQPPAAEEPPAPPQPAAPTPAPEPERPANKADGKAKNEEADGAIDFADEIPSQSEETESDPTAEEEPEEGPDIDADLADDAANDVTKPESPPKDKKAALKKHIAVGAAAVGLTLLLLIGGSFLFKNTIQSTFPATQGLFAMFEPDPPLPGEGLEIRDVTTERELQGLHDVIVIKGVVTNITDEMRVVPPLRVAILGEEEAILQTEIIAASAPEVDGGKSVEFEATLLEPGDHARNLKISFADPGEEPGTTSGAHDNATGHGDDDHGSSGQ
jgi:predicted Zn finger-like uncharacterized protein